MEGKKPYIPEVNGLCLYSLLMDGADGETFA